MTEQPADQPANLPDVHDTPCPICDHKTLQIVMRIEAKPPGTFSLSGVQMKVSAAPWPYLMCTNCGAEARGRRG